MDTVEVCRNCKREIPSVNYVMHVAHCSRNLEICVECGEPVHISLKEQHRKENHETIQCGLCGQDVIKPKLEDHMENWCLEKLVECSTCGLELPFSKLNDHELFCRSRTELCDGCHKYVMFKDMNNHVCQQRRRISKDEESVTLPCEFCEQQVGLDELATHQSTCPAATEEDDVEVIYDSNDHNFTPRGGVETSDGCFSDGNNSIYALPCEFCDELYPSDKLQNHQLECGHGDDADEHNDDDDEYVNNDEMPLPCEFCEKLFPSDKLCNHQLDCAQRTETDDDSDEYVNIFQRRGPGVHSREDPFNMATLHQFMFGPILRIWTISHETSTEQDNTTK